MLKCRYYLVYRIKGNLVSIRKQIRLITSEIIIYSVSFHSFYVQGSSLFIFFFFNVLPPLFFILLSEAKFCCYYTLDSLGPFLYSCLLSQCSDFCILNPSQLPVIYDHLREFSKATIIRSIQICCYHFYVCRVLYSSSELSELIDRNAVKIKWK